MATATVAEMVDSEVDIDPTARDLAINSAKSHITGYMEASSLVSETDSERMKAAIAKTAVNLIIRKRKSYDKTKEINPSGILTKEVKQLLDDSTDDSLTNQTLVVNNTKLTRPNKKVQWRD